MAKFPHIPFWVDAWTADTSHLTRCERGTYLDLLVLMWRSPGCRVPNDDAWLSKHMRMTPSEVANELRPLIAEFCQTSGNWLTQKRLVQEFLFVKRKSRKQSVNAKSRWNKEKDTCQRNATTTTVGIAPTPTPTPTKKVLKEGDVLDRGHTVPTNSTTTIGEYDFASDDGSVIVTADEFDRLDKELPSLKNIRGRVRYACRSWLETVPEGERKRALLAWLRKKNAEEASKFSREPYGGPAANVIDAKAAIAEAMKRDREMRDRAKRGLGGYRASG